MLLFYLFTKVVQHYASTRSNRSFINSILLVQKHDLLIFQTKKTGKMDYFEAIGCVFFLYSLFNKQNA